MKEIMFEKQIVNQTSQKLTLLLWSLNVNYHLPKSKLPNNCPELHKWRLHPYSSSCNIYFKWSTYIYLSMFPSVLFSSCFLLPCYFLHLRFKYFPQHSFPKHPKPSLCRPILHAHNKGRIIVLFLSYMFMYPPGISFSFSFDIQINDCSITITTFSNVTLFTDNTSLLFSNNKYDDFQRMFISVLSWPMSKWFQANQLVLHVEKNKYCKIHSL
jgi:hypothetical protein